MVKEINIGTDLIDEIQKYDVILIGTSIKNSLGNGFQHKIGVNFRDVLIKNNETNYDDPKKLGTCEVITSYVKQGFPIFVLCYITKGRYRPDIIPDALDYDALKSCLELVNEHFKGKKVASTLMGSEKYEGGGDSREIYKIIANACTDIDLYIYDYIQRNFREENYDNYLNIVNEYAKGKITREEYNKRKIKHLWEQSFGKYLSLPPENLTIREVKQKIKEIKNTWKK